MEDARHSDREVINRYLRVFDVDHDRFMGYLVDITPVGAMLQSREAIEPEKRFKLRLELPEDFGDGREIVLEAESRWEKKEENALFHHTGFRFVGMDPNDEPRIRRLIDAYRIEGLSH